MESKELKQKLLMMAVSEVELLLTIIGELGFIGYKVVLFNLRGQSLQQCATKFKISKRTAQYIIKKSNEKGYSMDLKRILPVK